MSRKYVHRVRCTYLNSITTIIHLIMLHNLCNFIRDFSILMMVNSIFIHCKLNRLLQVWTCRMIQYAVWIQRSNVFLWTFFFQLEILRFLPFTNNNYMYKISIEKLAPNWYQTSVSLSLTLSFFHFLTLLYSYVTMIFKMNTVINLEFECILMMTIRKQWTTRNHTTYMFIFAEAKRKKNHPILSIYTRSKWKKCHT